MIRIALLIHNILVKNRNAIYVKIGDSINNGHKDPKMPNKAEIQSKFNKIEFFLFILPTNFLKLL